jgi:hypothetical protein
MLCLEDPLLGPDPYVYVEADASDLHPIALGLRAWIDALADGSVHLFGEPGLVTSRPGWFLPVEGTAGAPPLGSNREAGIVPATGG